GELADRPLDADLQVERGPEEVEGGAGIGLDLAGLAALVVGEESQAAAANALEEHDPGGRRAARVHRGQGHRVRMGDAGVNGALNPNFKLSKRVLIERKVAGGHSRHLPEFAAELQSEAETGVELVDLLVI